MPERPADESVERMEFLLTLRQRGIVDQAVLRAMDEVPREHFVEPLQADAAYADQALPIACGQTISQPYVVAYMTEQLAVRADAPRARGRHRLGLPGGGAVAARPRGGQRRALSHAGGCGARAAGRRSATATSRWCWATGWSACRRARRSTASSSPPRRRSIPQALTEQLAEGGIMVLPLGPHGGPAGAGQADQDRRGDRPAEPDRGALRAAVARPRPRIVRMAKLRGKQRVFD